MPEDNRSLLRSLIEKVTAMQIAVMIIGLSMIAALTWFILDQGKAFSDEKIAHGFIVFVAAIGLLAIVTLALLYVIFSSGDAGNTIVQKVMEMIGKITPLQVATTVIGILAVAGIIWVIVGGASDFLTDSAKARGLITFSVAIATVAIALIMVFFLIFGSADDADQLKERFTFGKDILLVFVGILGTIMGFYYGNADKLTAKDIPALANGGQSSASKITRDLEQKAFQLILKQDLENASKAFDDVYNAPVTSSNITNILAVQKLLSESKPDLSSADELKKKKAWSDLQCKISKGNMADGMPREITEGFDKGCQAAPTPTPTPTPARVATPIPTQATSQ